MRRNPVRWIVGVIVAAVIVFAAIGSLSHSSFDPPAATPVGTSEPAGIASPPPSGSPGTALAELQLLPVKGKSPMTGYSRTGDFGRAWLDVDHNGCDTRNDILARDLTSIDRPGGCRVLTGTLAEPYTGKVIDFVRGNRTSTLVQIDHLVALGNAWQTGAQKLTQEQRTDLANDPLELLAVDGSSNESKGDGDAATWLPPRKAFRCAYVARQVAVKTKYHLWVTPAEKAAIARILTACPGQPAITG